MSTTKNGVAKCKISKTSLSNWDRRLEILDNSHNIITKVWSRDGKGKGNTKQKHNKGWSWKLTSEEEEDTTKRKWIEYHSKIEMEERRF
jgi:hypothetical protein